MTGTYAINVTLRYLRAGKRKAESLKISANDYFDPAHRLSGRDAILSPPRYQYTWKYLSIPDGILSTTLTLVDKKHGLKRVVSTSYWDDMQSDLTEVTNYAGNDSVKYRELILAQKLSIANMAGWLVERLAWSRTHWIPGSAAFVEQRDDGTQRDYPVSLKTTEHPLRSTGGEIAWAAEAVSGSKAKKKR